MKKFKELLKKKLEEGKVLSGDKKKAKCEMLDELDGITKNAMSDKLKGMKKVTVASPTSEGLEKGLEMAKEKVSDMDEEKEDDKEPKSDKIAELKKKISELKG